MQTFHELSNGRYSVKLTSAGGGLSSWNGIALNRWPADAVRDVHGLFIYLRDVESGEFWATSIHGASVDGNSVTFKSSHHQITSELRVSVENEIEFRRLDLHNDSERKRRLEVTSFMEVALADRMSDLTHPAFSKLFVQTAFWPERATLTAQRRPRSSDEHWPTLEHSLIGAKVIAWETDRATFLGRGRSAANPKAQIKGTVGNVLDPCMALRTMIELEAGASAEVTFTLRVSNDGAAPSASIICDDRASNPASLRSYGEFSADGSEFIITQQPLMPWCNVIANERFGFITSETGAGCTWSRNSQANRLTPWSNDPISDPHGESITVRDADTGEVWSALPGPCPAQADYRMAHGFGFSCCRVTAHETTMFVPRRDPVKLVRLSLTNTSSHTRSLFIEARHELVLGTLPASTLRTWSDNEALFAENPANTDFKDGITFSYASIHPETRGIANSSFVQTWRIELRAGESMAMGIVFGEAVGEEELKALLLRYRKVEAVDAALAEVKSFWSELTGRLRVTTPAPEIDHMVNGWLLYQAISSRIWARTAYYQSSGAFGFRDQLQDAGNLVMVWPELTREQILLHARHQFAEGDVLHWWHEPPIRRGLRTCFSDDLLWLPFFASAYVRATGDATLWDSEQPFASAPILRLGQDENYEVFTETVETATLFEHCCRALDRSHTSGVHGLPLMGTGDWNDGMNRVGREGRGESVWLGFFLCPLLDAFIPMARHRGESARAERYETHRDKLHAALNQQGWDGEWYRRAYYDDGTPLGTNEASECQIDGLVQAWAVLSGVAPKERAEMSMRAVEERLIDEDDGLIRLLRPPFQDCAQDPGYIKGYVAGVRENGGQYTHAACWVVQALAKLGHRQRAARLLTMLSPLAHTRTSKDVERYKVEPYAIAADVYGAAPHIGRGGWTWYTGSAGWAFRVAVESVLGLSVEDGQTLVLKPCVPDEWPAYHLSYQPPGCTSRYEIDVRNPTLCSECIVGATLDGARLDLDNGELRLPMIDDGLTHEIVVELGRR